ncbi:pyrimidine operon attenuation protein / uracil phosphoribosyltransferase [Nonlabens sp. Hel1_33_55]|uniref:phosphoribosyltransferase domain-containing protein n=1 Tax=Nonlabens sp. Hel1_33_55 TaxID=1336802 RepID=UPI000875EEFD|nr:phosphoribosyltransferase family protein [Nonlabens sp. Hel1_33_55]SCY20254.1 pyrimidine operon attenuation protein / uracil phosphoribosyltransferase [Nonlabens sp. Hel1_33_55]
MEILNHEQVNHKIRRIAYQIAEVYMEHDELILAGIADGGYILAKLLKVQLELICDFKITLCEVTMDKKNPRNAVETSLSPKEYSDKGVVLCDDVLNSGTTLIYAVRHFLDVPVKKFKTAVLVNRNHKKFPVKADFKGISLSTTMEEHITVVLNKNTSSVSLS